MRLSRSLVALATVTITAVALSVAATATSAHSRFTRTPAGTSLSRPSGAPRAVSSPTEPGLTLGLSGALNDLTGGGSTQDAFWANLGHQVGAQIVRLNVKWSDIAPTIRPAGFDASNSESPGYDFSTLDSQVRTLNAEGFEIFLSVASAPTWAEGAHIPAQSFANSWKPRPADLGQFATAIARRYDGRTADPLDPGVELPQIHLWQAWNEPNMALNLSPQWLRSGRREIAESPVLYRRMENAFYAAVKAVSAANFVVGAGTAPYGDTPGGLRMAPVTFDQTLFCLNASGQRTAGCRGVVHLDAVDDHPYVSGLCCHGPTWHALSPLDTSVPDVYKIVNLLKAAKTAGTVAPAKAAVWASELGWTTDPPNPNFDSASSATVVGRWATQALYILWTEGVSTVLWYQLGDDPEASGGWAATVTEGLYFAAGSPKPAAAAFAFPFLTHRVSQTTVEAWGRAPAAGRLTIQERSGANAPWRSILTLAVHLHQVFQVPVTLSQKASFRAVEGTSTSPAWSQSA